jgi:hypothetical protein
MARGGGSNWAGAGCNGRGTARGTVRNERGGVRK